MKIKETLAPVAAAALLAGCGATHSSKEKAAPQSLKPKPAPANTTTVNNWTEDMIKSLNDYRNGVLVRHKARVALGTCVAWSTTISATGEDGTTVTLNPGVMESEGQEYYVFSSHDPRYKPDWGPLNGPVFLSPLAEVVIMTSSNVIDAKTERHLLPQEERDMTGQRYFEDVKTHEPVLDTAIVPGNLSVSALKTACLDLRDHIAIIVHRQTA